MENAKLVKVISSDNSVSWNVRVFQNSDTKPLVFIAMGCASEYDARLLVKCINDAKWIRIDVI